MGAERILICTVVFILAVVIPTCVGQTIPSDACLQASSLNGTYTLSKQTSGRDVCFRISPLLPKGKQASSISLKFTNFSFAGQSKLHIYSSSFVNENKVTVYSGVLGKEEAPPPELTIKAPAVLLYAKGSGERSFTVVYKVSDELVTIENKNVLYAIAFVFGAPFVLAGVTCIPCLEDVDWHKKNKIRLILFLIGTGIGGLFFTLILTRAINL